MKNRFSLILTMAFGLSCAACTTFAQELTVAPAHLVCDYNVPEKLDTQVKSKLQRALSQYGISAGAGMSRFAMVPEVAINDEQTLATVPVKCNVDFDFVVTLQDAFSGKVFSTFTLSATGTGNNKANALSLGISKLKLSGKDFSEFCEDSKKKVVAYYESQVSTIIAKSQSAASARHFDEALYILSEIPEECPSFATRVAPLIQEYYEKERDLFGEKILADARAAWAASPNAEGAARVAEILSYMPPSCSSSAAARDFVSKIGTKVEALQNWELRYMEREQAYKHDERKAVIEAAKAIGEAYAKNQPVPIYKVNVW